MRIYGLTMGYGSYAQVLRGFVIGMRPVRTDVVSIDVPSDDIIPGATTRTGIMLGPPAYAKKMSRNARHERRIVMVAPNSTWVPEDLHHILREYVTEVFVPSAWAKEILERYTQKPVRVVPHGVFEGFKPVAPAPGCLSPEETYRAGCFDVLHLASTSRERKGSRELIRAWKILRERKVLPTDARLIVVMPSEEALSLILDIGKPEDVAVHHRLNLPPDELAAYYSNAHVVCQPSRGEAFGMIPLEALASGTPVVMTKCTGHAEYASVLSEAEGVVEVVRGPDGPIDDGPGAMAPTVEPEAIAAALERAFMSYPALALSARKNADRIRSQHSWQEALRAFRTDSLKEIGT